MKITAAEAHIENFPLTRPYTIAYRSIDAVENVIVRIHAEHGLIGYGAASPEAQVTGETNEDCRKALNENALSWLIGRDVRHLNALCLDLQRHLPRTPAARAAIDMALHDLFAQHLGIPLVDLLGRAHESLPTSITIGIKPVDDTLLEAREYVKRGFHILKVKLGQSLDEDIERLARLHEMLPSDILVRADANQGYSVADVRRFMAETAAFDLEFLEQPLPASDSMHELPDEIRSRIAADESLLSDKDALCLATDPRACGIFNVKLMKCGGIRPAMRIATIAETSGISLMWGCMDESAISIGAALHAALASPATRYLDLDGSLDLARDVVKDTFILDNGYMRTTEASGLGVVSDQNSLF